MPLLSPEIIQLLAVFAPAMTAPTFANACTLLCGTILAPGRRTVTGALRVLGLEGGNFGKYHRVLNRARWSPFVLSRLLLWLLVRLFLAAGAPLRLVVDETLQRRWGKRLRYRGWFRDAVRSTAHQTVTCPGIRWLCVCLLVDVPWSARPWALPFLVVPVLSERTCQRLKKRHRSGVEWVAFLLAKIRRWFPEREVELVGDGGYAAVSLVRECQQGEKPIRLVARLRLDAALYDFPGPQPKSKRGPKPKKGKRQRSLTERLTDRRTVFRRVRVRWYGGEEKPVEVATGVALWYTPGQLPVGIRWVLVRSPHGEPAPLPPAAFLCSEQATTAEAILAAFIRRWNIEVTFEELRAHLGLEGQRHWSTRAVGRTTPCLFGGFSLVVAMAKVLHPETLPRQESGWYRKEEATFSDALAAVRRHLWAGMNHVAWGAATEWCLIPRPLWQRLQQVVCYAA